MKKALNFLLILTFALTLLVPLTGVPIHKSASLLFLLLCVVHAALHWRKMDARRGCCPWIDFCIVSDGSDWADF